MVIVPLGNQVKAVFEVNCFLLNFPSNLEFKKILKMVVLPRNGCFYFEWVARLKVGKAQIDKNKAIGVDHGFDNWLTCVSSVGASFIVDGNTHSFICPPGRG